jgi:hypothetical protein
MDMSQVLMTLKMERARIDATIAAIEAIAEDTEGAVAASMRRSYQRRSVPQVAKAKRDPLSKAGRAKQIAGMKRYWAERRKAKEAKAAKAATRKGKTVTPKEVKA